MENYSPLKGKEISTENVLEKDLMADILKIFLSMKYAQSTKERFGERQEI